MKTYDLVIKNGTIIDGKRTPRFTGDIGIVDGLIDEIGRIDESNAKKVIDATGLIVAPGTVDLHTHFDSQLFWDPWCTMGGWHGITSVVIGNCGFGFAPVKPEDQDMAMKTMERNEAVRFETMKEGMPWDWETHPEYLDSVERTPKGVNVLTYTPLGPIMSYVMGRDNAKSRACTPEEQKEICRLIGESIDAGSCGISAQKLGVNSVQRDVDGTPMITDTMSEEDFLAFAGVLKEKGKGLIQVLGGEREQNEKLMDASGRPLLWNAVALVTDAHGLTFGSVWELTDWLEKCNAEGKRIIGHAVTAASDYQFTLEDFNLFDSEPDWRVLTMGTIEERIEKMKDPALRAPLIENYKFKHSFLGAIASNIHELKFAECQNQELNVKYAGLFIHEIAEQENKHPIDVFLDLSIADNLQVIWVTPPQRIEMESMKRLANHPFTVPGLSDGGAHMKFLTMGRYPTEFIAHLVRDNNIMSLEKAHWKLAAYPAQIAGFKDRGSLQEGLAADIIIYDLDELDVLPMERIYDFPAGDWRLAQKSTGYKWTIVNGEVTFVDGECTNATPGVLLRNGAAA